MTDQEYARLSDYIDWSDHKSIYDFIETQIAQAEKRGEERMKKKCVVVIEERIDDIKVKRKITPVHFIKTANWLEWWEDSLGTIRNSISSL